jgi:hypothetical protein
LCEQKEGEGVMKAFKTIISIVFIVGTIAIIFMDGKTKAQKKSEPMSVSGKVDTTVQPHHKN